MESLYSIPPLRMARVQIELQPEGIVSIGMEQRGNVLRGAFGDCFRRLICDPACSGYEDCPRKGSCPHELLFAPKCPPGAPKRLKTPPRAYLFRPPLEHGSCFTASRPLRFEVRLFGEAISTAPLFLRAFQLLARNGIAERRMHLVSAYSLDWNEKPYAELVRAGQLTKEQPLALEFASFFREESGPDEATIEYLSPTLLNKKGEDPKLPAFSALVCRLSDRIDWLCQLYEGQKWQAQFSAIECAATGTTKIKRSGGWEEITRSSTRTDEEMPLGGFRGSFTYKGIDLRLWPLLRIGEEIHVGGKVVWGHGRYRILSADASRNEETSAKP
jgi:hypothetical protein